MSSINPISTYSPHGLFLKVYGFLFVSLLCQKLLYLIAKARKHQEKSHGVLDSWFGKLVIEKAALADSAVL